MNIRRKGAGIAFTATLLSALVATIAAPFVSASATVGGAGAVPRGGTSSGTVTFTFTENAANCLPNINMPNALNVQILDSAGNPTVHFSGTPTVVANGTLGATATVSGTNTLNISFAGSAPLQQEQVTVSGLKISADAGAASGSIGAYLVPPSTQASCFIAATGTATGITSVPIAAGGGNDPAVSLTGNCAFAVTGGSNGQAKFADAGTAVADVTAIGLTTNDSTPPHPGPGDTQDVTFGASTPAVGHAAGVAVSQTVDIGNCNTLIGSAGSVANALEQTANSATIVSPGETNQAAGNTVIAEYPFGDEVTIGGSITFAITTPGVTFSGSPTADPTSDISLGAIIPAGPPPGLGTPVSCNLSVDRKSCSVTVTANNGTAGTACPAPSGTCGNVTLTNVTLDVDTTAVLGSAVKLTVTTSAPLIVTSSTIATVGRVIIASAAQPVVFIGQNNQASGTIKLTESGPGFFSAGPGPTNYIVLCYFTGETFTTAPWAVVTTGDLKLLSGLTGVTQVQGTLVNISGNACAYWNVFSASTVASTIEIRGSADGTTPLGPGDNNGPRLNVAAGLAPGSSQAALFVGPFLPTTSAGFQLFSNAIRAFQNSVTVTASSQPRCLPGATDCLAGNLVVTETQNGQLKPGMVITVNILPRATTQRNDVLLQTTSTNQTPIATANTSASGLLVTPVGVTCTPSAILGIVVCNFAVSVTQQSFGPTLGTITFSNIHYVVAADAVNGPVNVDVTGITGVGGGQVFDSVVSNAIIGAAPVVIATKTQAASAVGKTNNSVLFTVGTKVITVNPSSNNIATIRIKVDPALIGKSVAIEVAKKTGSTWSAFTKVTTRVIGADGYAYYYASTKSAQWLSFRGFFQGDATHSASRSQTVQVRWIS